MLMYNLNKFRVIATANLEFKVLVTHLNKKDKSIALFWKYKF